MNLATTISLLYGRREIYAGNNDGCDWITKDGVHLCIGKGGDIIKGPKHLMGKNVGGKDSGWQGLHNHWKSTVKDSDYQGKRTGLAPEMHKAAKILDSRVHKDVLLRAPVKNLVLYKNQSANLASQTTKNMLELGKRGLDVRTVLHEFGHHLDHNLLSNKNAEDVNKPLVQRLMNDANKEYRDTKKNVVQQAIQDGRWEKGKDPHDWENNKAASKAGIRAPFADKKDDAQSTLQDRWEWFAVAFSAYFHKDNSERLKNESPATYKLVDSLVKGKILK